MLLVGRRGIRTGWCGRRCRRCRDRWGPAAILVHRRRGMRLLLRQFPRQRKVRSWSDVGGPLFQIVSRWQCHAADICLAADCSRGPEASQPGQPCQRLASHASLPPRACSSANRGTARRRHPCQRAKPGHGRSSGRLPVHPHRERGWPGAIGAQHKFPDTVPIGLSVK